MGRKTRSCRSEDSHMTTPVFFFGMLVGIFIYRYWYEIR